jgi:DNA polymerase-3 subunit epsilon
MTGYAVVDLETTGLFPQRHDRIIEISLITVSDDGTVQDEWTTLVNPERDPGPTDIHGISARDIVAAPTFRELAPHVVRTLNGRTLVAHNSRFDTQFLDHEFARAGVGTRPPTPSLCTMGLAASYARGVSRKLKDCCAAARIEHRDEHTALGDARAVAALLRHYLRQAGTPVPWSSTIEQTRRHWWPPVAVVDLAARIVARDPRPRRPDAWLDRITSAVPRNPEPRIEAYLDVLERALLDGYLSAHEEAALVELALALGLHRDQVTAVHGMYLDAMAIAAWEDGVVTDRESTELRSVAGMLGLPTALVGIALRRAEAVFGRTRAPSIPQLRLTPGDQVVFTGALSVPRDQLVLLAEQAGLATGGVTRKTKVVVAADPDSQSGKAAKARQYGVPVVTEAAFVRLLEGLYPET